MQVMNLVQGKASRGYLPDNDSDLPLFRHFCEGMIEVKDIEFYRPVFEAHGWAFQITDEAA